MESREDLESLSDACFRDSLRLIYELTGISIAESRRSMVQGRLRKRAAELKLATYESYLERVKADDAEKTIFVDLVTTNETYFFRTPRIWSFIRDELLPAWHARNPGKTFLAWSAAASSGDEAHSLGILLQSFRDQHPDFNYRILGTDISQEMVRRCREGVYEGRALQNFQATRPDWFEKYMVALGEGRYRVRPDITARLSFRDHNLFRNLASGESFDLILVRNVLIYFKGEDQERALRLLEPRLGDEGVLIIGESESLTHIQTGFRSIQPLVYRKASALPTGKSVA